jgi:hypothetical protein
MAALTLAQKRARDALTAYWRNKYGNIVMGPKKGLGKNFRRNLKQKKPLSPGKKALEDARNNRMRTRSMIKQKKGVIPRLKKPYVCRGLPRKSLLILEKMVGLLPPVKPSYEPELYPGMRRICEYPEIKLRSYALAPLKKLIRDIQGTFGCNTFSGLAIIDALPTLDPDNHQNYHCDNQAPSSLNVLINLCTVRRNGCTQLDCAPALIRYPTHSTHTHPKPPR